MYEFVLKFDLPEADQDPQVYMDALFEAGCDDATIGIGKRGSIALDFERDAASAEEAVDSAIQDVQKAIPGAKLTEIEPDLVNLEGIAEAVGSSRQNLRKYAAGEITTVKARFPAPVLTGKTASYWHLAEALRWLEINTSLRVPPQVKDVSFVAAKKNLLRQLHDVDGRDEPRRAAGQ